MSTKLTTTPSNSLPRAIGQGRRRPALSLLRCQSPSSPHEETSGRSIPR
uniref:Uncharacterized protein n=1 Tax=Arundo donax TaxID=35708 RepID=A0A0A9BVQ8_ARUDO